MAFYAFCILLDTVVPHKSYTYFVFAHRAENGMPYLAELSDRLGVRVAPPLVQFMAWAVAKREKNRNLKMTRTGMLWKKFTLKLDRYLWSPILVFTMHRKKNKTLFTNMFKPKNKTKTNGILTFYWLLKNRDDHHQRRQTGAGEAPTPWERGHGNGIFRWVHPSNYIKNSNYINFKISTLF